MVEIKLSNGSVALVDEEDVAKLEEFHWHCDDAGYARTNVWKDGRKSAAPRMHRLVLSGVDSRLHVDHINGNRLDNRKSNLRISTCSENLRNRGPQANNSSGYKGVIFDKARGKWRAEICVEKRRKYLGRFSSPIEAAMAYNKAAIELHGEYAYQNKIG